MLAACKTLANLPEDSSPESSKEAKALVSATRCRLDATSSGNLPQAAERALRITVAQDTLRVLFTVPAGRTHRLGARELKRELPSQSDLQICPQEPKKPGLPPGETTPCPW